MQTKKHELQQSNPSPNSMETYHGLPSMQSYTFFHETKHLGQLVTSPRALDAAYGPKNCYDLARTRNTDRAVYNADSWGMTALATCAQKLFHLPNPPKPEDYLIPAQMKSPQIEPVNETVADDVIYVDSTSVVPQGASPVFPDQAYFVNTTLWEIQEPVGLFPSAFPSPSSSSPSPVPYTPTASTSLPPSSSPPSPAYATGTCSFHLTETQDCQSTDRDLYAIINLKDGAGNDIGDTNVDTNTNPFGEGINDGSPYTFNSTLPHPLVVTGEHENDYIQFTYGSLSWQSRTLNAGGRCVVAGWNPPDAPQCWIGSLSDTQVNDMDCYFPC